MKLIYNFKLISKDNSHTYNPRTKRAYLDPKYKAWAKEVQIETRNQYKGAMLEDDLYMLINAFFKHKTHCDTQNLPKGLCDSLEWLIYENDKQIKHLEVIVNESSDRDYFTVEVEIL